ncbi:hypothetical protein AMR41_28990 [Hapalosiphon sp. MRB220]|nr:hypothetical protein AMR41_28990 [Hapalosiphon sp. MRB220]
MMGIVKSKIAICHQTAVTHDAIGNDICGMYDLLASMGFEPVILCEYADETISKTKITNLSFKSNEINNYGIVIYHHSIFWKRGEELLNLYKGIPIIKFHNITPPYFFDTYSSRYTKICRDGWEQTKRFINLKKPHFWLADSEFNQNDLLNLGEKQDYIEVVPPFHKFDTCFLERQLTSYENKCPYYAMFVGRIAPNKGHMTLLKILHSYKTRISNNIVLRIAGKGDEEISGYGFQIEKAINELDIAANIEFVGNLSQDNLNELFQTSHLYLCTSEHEGFCVPIIESQVVGLPIVAMDSSAVKETMGEGQLVLPKPSTDEDYFLYARIIQEVCSNIDLRHTVIRNGYRNFRKRFTKEVIENKFINAIMPFIRRIV